MRTRFPVEPATDSQRDSLKRFGYDPDLSKAKAHAVITDIYESLNFEVAQYEDLPGGDVRTASQRCESKLKAAILDYINHHNRSQSRSAGMRRHISSSARSLQYVTHFDDGILDARRNDSALFPMTSHRLLPWWH